MPLTNARRRTRGMERLTGMAFACGRHLLSPVRSDAAIACRVPEPPCAVMVTVSMAKSG